MIIERNTSMLGRVSKEAPWRVKREDGTVLGYGKTKQEAQQKALDYLEDLSMYVLAQPAVGVALDGRILVGRVWATGEVYLQWFADTAGCHVAAGATVGKLAPYKTVQAMVDYYVDSYNEAAGLKTA